MTAGRGIKTLSVHCTAEERACSHKATPVKFRSRQHYGELGTSFFTVGLPQYCKDEEGVSR